MARSKIYQIITDKKRAGDIKAEKTTSPTRRRPSHTQARSYRLDRPQAMLRGGRGAARHADLGRSRGRMAPPDAVSRNSARNRFHFHRFRPPATLYRPERELRAIMTDRRDQGQFRAAGRVGRPLPLRHRARPHPGTDAGGRAFGREQGEGLRQPGLAAEADRSQRWRAAS